jgi:hypothetical protein
MGHISQAPRLSFRALQHFRYQAPFFSLSVSEKRLKTSCPGLQKSRTQGLATLSAVSACSIPGDPLSNPNAPELRPSKLSSSPMVEFPFRRTLSALALPYKTLTGLVPAPQRLPPTEKAVPLTALAEGLIRPGTLALLGFLTS